MRVECIPYKGSKARIAAEIISHIPSRKTFVDLFCGGGALTVAAALSGRFDNFIINDISPGLTQLFVDAIKGKYHNRTEWVSREDFFAKKNNDAFIRFCWSFGNNGRDYLFSRDIEPLKRAVHIAVVNNDYAPLGELNIYPPH